MMTAVVLAAAVAATAIALLARQGRAIEIPDVSAVEPIEWSKPVGAAVTVEPAREDDAYRRAFVARYSSLTPENEMKWERVQPRPGEFQFREADALVRFAERHGKRVRGHPLVWDQQLPAWLVEGDWTAPALERVLRDHVRALVSRYRGRVAVWDVVNEPFEADGTWTESLWHRVLGDRYVEIAFEAAREADPDVGLVLNEIAAEAEGPKSTALWRLARRLRDRGVPIDGVGLQNHTTAEGFPSRERWQRLFADYARLGLDVEITEMDVAMRPGTSVETQVRAYRAAAEACATARNCAGLTVWGVTDRWSWIGAERRALPLDAEGRPKPAFAALRSALAR